jgi:hypothetical protein
MRCDQGVDVGCGVSGLWGDLQSPCPFWHSWVVDRLDVDAVIYHQDVRKNFHFTGSPTITGMLWLKLGVPLTARRARSCATLSC